VADIPTPEQVEAIGDRLAIANGLAPDESMARWYRKDIAALLAAYDALAAEVLAAHGEQHIATVDGDLWCTTCDRTIGSAEDDAETDRVIATHQADMLAAAGLLPDGEEWAVETTGTNPDHIDMDDEAQALLWLPPDGVDKDHGWHAVHRYVTEWRTA